MFKHNLNSCKSCKTATLKKLLDSINTHNTKQIKHMPIDKNSTPIALDIKQFLNTVVTLKYEMGFKANLLTENQRGHDSDNVYNTKQLLINSHN